MQTSTSFCAGRDGTAPIATMAQLEQPLLDGALPRARCLAWLTAALLTVLIFIQIAGAPVVP